MKGADAVMANIVQYNDWLDEEVMNTSRLSHAQTHTHTHSHTCAHTHTHTHTHTHHTHTHAHTHHTHTHTQCGNMAREGLRTLVVGKRVLTEEQYVSFEVSADPVTGTGLCSTC